MQIDPRLAVAVAGQTADKTSRGLNAAQRVSGCALEAGVRLENLQLDSALRAHAQAQARLGKGRRAVVSDEARVAVGVDADSRSEGGNESRIARVRAEARADRGARRADERERVEGAVGRFVRLKGEEAAVRDGGGELGCKRLGGKRRLRAVAAVAQQIQPDRLPIQRQQVPLRGRALRRAHVQPRAEHGGRNFPREAEGRAGPPQRLIKFRFRARLRRFGAFERLRKQPAVLPVERIEGGKLILRGLTARLGAQRDGDGLRRADKRAAGGGRGIGQLRLIEAEQSRERAQHARQPLGLRERLRRQAHDRKRHVDQHENRDQNILSDLQQPSAMSSFLLHACASAAGMVMRTEVPLPYSDEISMLPLCWFRISCAMERPRPVPPDSRERALSTR